MHRYLITDRSKLAPGQGLVELAVAHQPDFVQLREKDLDARSLAELASAMAAHGLRVLVNSRVDVAIACGVAGAHLPANSPPPRLWRRVAPSGFLIGVSCHTVDETRRAESEGASYVLFAPVFEPISKSSLSPPAGLKKLAQACAAVRIPVWALGGITRENAGLCVAAGAVGVAGISLFL